MPSDVLECLGYKASRQGFNMYIFVKKVKQGDKTYYYLVIEEYNPESKRKRVLLHLSLRKILELYKNESGGGKDFPWCGGWDLNPRRPTPSGPQPDPFGQARAPPLQWLHMPRGWALNPSLWL